MSSAPVGEATPRVDVSQRVATWALWALAVSTLGDSLVDGGLLVAAAVNSSLNVGLLGLAVGLPYLLSGRVGHMLATTDLSRPALMAGACLGSAGAASMIAFALTPDRPVVGLVYIGAAVLTILAVAVQAVFWDAIADIVADRSARVRYTARSTTLAGLAAVVGPAAGATLMRPFGIPALCIADAATFVLTAPVLARLAGGGRATAAQTVESSSQPYSRRLFGLRALATTRSVRAPVAGQVAANFVLYGVIYLIPLRTRDAGWDPRWAGVLLATLALGTVLGSLVAGSLVTTRQQTAGLVAEPALRAAALVGVVLAHGPGVVTVCVLLFSAPQGFGRVARKSLMLNAFSGPDRVHVLSTYTGVINASLPVAPVVMAAAVGAFGVIPYGLASVGILICCCIGLLADRHAISRAMAE